MYRFLQILFVSIWLSNCNQSLENTGVPPIVADTASNLSKPVALQLDSIEDLTSFKINAHYLSLDSEINSFLIDSSLTRKTSREFCEGDACYKYLKVADTLRSSIFYIIKYDVSEYSFGNSQYYYKGDNLIMVRNFKHSIQWSEKPNTPHSWLTTETLYLFDEFYVKIHSRNKLTENHLDYSLEDIPFVVKETEVEDTLYKVLGDFSEIMSLQRDSRYP